MLHNVLFVQYNSPVTKNYYPMKKVTFPIFFYDESCKVGFAFYSRALETIFGTLKIGKNNPEIANLEFESHGFLKMIFLFQLKNWAKYMVNGISRREFFRYVSACSVGRSSNRQSINQSFIYSINHI